MVVSDRRVQILRPREEVVTVIRGLSRSDTVRDPFVTPSSSVLMYACSTVWLNRSIWAPTVFFTDLVFCVILDRSNYLKSRVYILNLDTIKEDCFRRSRYRLGKDTNPHTSVTHQLQFPMVTGQTRRNRSTSGTSNLSQVRRERISQLKGPRIRYGRDNN